ncbi:MAG TPA: phosphatidate cytidylyltransferase [Alphaproteobacteria bacterium]
MPSETAQRVVTAIALAVPAAAALILGPPFLPLFIGAIAAVMAWEWVHVTGAAVFGLTGGTLAALLIAAIAAASFGRFYWAYGIVAAAVPIVYAVARARARAHALPIAAGAIYIGVPALSLLWLYARPEIGRGFVIWLICVVIACDVGAYFVGRTLKGPKLWPRVSPGKTWSGAVGGVAAAVALGVALGMALGLAPAIFLAGAALVFAVISEMGDLLESGVKRAFRVKDASGILPGHGGMMDRVDGIVAALVVAALAIWIAGGDPRLWR